MGLGVYPDSEQGPDTDTQGARIRGVVEGGPADEAGLREGDILVELNGRSLLEPLPDPEDEDDLEPDQSLPIQRLVATAQKLDPGDEVEIVYLRGGQRRTTTLTAEAVGGAGVWVGGMPGRLEARLGELRAREGEMRDLMREPAIARFYSGPGGRCPGHEGGWSMLMDACVSGVRLVPLNQRLGEYFEADEGILVADVAEDSSLGLEPGDVILAIDGREVDEVEDVTRILGSYRKGEEVSFRVVRRGERLTVEGTAR